jgi:hypothetical protein
MSEHLIPTPLEDASALAESLFVRSQPFGSGFVTTVSPDLLAARIAKRLLSVEVIAEALFAYVPDFDVAGSDDSSTPHPCLGGWEDVPDEYRRIYRDQAKYVRARLRGQPDVGMLPATSAASRGVAA